MINKNIVFPAKEYPLYRMRIAHELGHVELHNELDFIRNRTQCEHEADLFAAIFKSFKLTIFSYLQS
jgi:Zn-dependent peptidase ImmA (M78 family)